MNVIQLTHDLCDSHKCDPAHMYRCTARGVMACQCVLVFEENNESYEGMGLPQDI